MPAQVQNAGLARITAALIALSWWLGWGTGSGAAKTAGNVTVGAATEARVVAGAVQGLTTVANDKIVLTGTVTAAGARAITEIGAFDALAAGNMDVYADFGVITLATGDSIAFTLNVTFS